MVGLAFYSADDALVKIGVVPIPRRKRARLNALAS